MKNALLDSSCAAGPGRAHKTAAQSNFQGSFPAARKSEWEDCLAQDVRLARECIAPLHSIVWLSREFLSFRPTALEGDLSNWHGFWTPGIPVVADMVFLCSRVFIVACLQATEMGTYKTILRYERVLLLWVDCDRLGTTGLALPISDPKLATRQTDRIV